MSKKIQKTILIAAPGSGIGKSITKNLLEDNHKIIGIGRENSKKFTEELRNEGFQISFFDCDCSNETEVVEVFRKIRKTVPKIDGMIHLIGGSFYSKKITELSYEEYRKVISVNLDSLFLIGKETLSWMSETGGGNIVFFGSTTGFNPSSKKMPYGVAKAGVHAMTWFFAQEGSEYQIVTNTIAPGYVLTERHIDDIERKSKTLNESYDNVLTKITSKNPLNQTLYPEDIYDLVIMLLTTKHVQGQVIRIDSGQILG